MLNRANTQVTVEHLLLAIALFVGAFLRLWQINALGYNSDEVVYASQGAAIAGVPEIKDIFPIFRAHPLFFQLIVGIAFHFFGVNDELGRLISVGFGLATILLVYRLGQIMYGRLAGALAALFVALMPYHIVVTRQVLLDGPLVLCTTLALYLLARFAGTQRAAWLYATGAAMGLAFLAKETAVVLLGSIYAFLALSPEIRVYIREMVLSVACMALVMAAFPLSLRLASTGGTKSGQSYLIWQIFRRPNHEWTFFPVNVTPAIGLLLILSAVLGLWLLRREHSWRERLLLGWILVPTIFFQLWPTKGFQYLLPIAPAVAVLATRLFVHPMGEHLSLLGHKLPVVWLRAAGVTVIVVSLSFASWGRIQPTNAAQGLAGAGGIAGAREAGLWVRDNIPEGATMITIGPSMANIIQFYGSRRAYGLSVSANPLRRNPSYQPIRNPDFQLRTGEMQYLVWDAYSARRTEHFSQKLLEYAKRYNARVVHTEIVQMVTDNGMVVAKPVIVIYEVRP